MKVVELRARIRQLDPTTPMHLCLADELREGAGYNGGWYFGQMEHWLRWLKGYHGPSAYGRKVTHGRDAKFVYNQGQCAPMLLWLGEAAGVP